MTKSIYDQLNASGTVAKQRVVETFSGDALDTDRWDTTVTFGACTFAMADAVDGGFDMTSAAANGVNNGGKLDFNDIRQFNNTGAVCIATWARLGSFQAMAGFETAFVKDAPADNSNKGLDTAGNSIYSTTANDTNFHTYKIELKSSSCEWSIDGVAQTSQTTSGNLPTAKMQPYIMTGTNQASAAQMRIRYMECYNT